jgi:hypothetical protein
MKKMPYYAENLIIAFFYMLVIHFHTFKPKSITKSTLFILTFIVLSHYLSLCVEETHKYDFPEHDYNWQYVI